MRSGSARKPWQSGLIGVIVLAVAMIGPWTTASAQDGSSSSSPSSSPSTTLTLGINSDLTSLNPFRLCCDADYEYLQLVYDLGIGFNNNDLTPAPMIVTSWTPDATSMNWTLKVRDDATWSDGTKLTAEDVAFTFSFIADNQMPYFKDYLPFEPTFEATDDTTVIWHSTKPTFAPTVPPYIMILPKHIWEQFSHGTPAENRKAAKEFKNDPPVGSGPFEVVDRSEGQFTHFHVRPDYWGGQPKAITDVIFRIYGSQESMAQALRSGEVDIVDSLEPSLFNALKGDPNIGLQNADEGCWGNLAFNFGGQGPDDTHHPAVEDVRVRQAVSYAINRKALVDKVYQGTAAVAYSVLVPGKNAAWYQDIPADLRFDYNPDTANQILDDAGYLDTDDDGIREMPDGTNPLNWDILSITDVQGSVETGQLLKGYLADVGIGVKLVTVDQKKAGDLWYSGDWTAYIWDWCPDPDPDFMLSVFTTDQCLGWSDGCYSDPAYDQMYEAQRSELDRDKRKEIIDQMQLYLAENVPTIVLNYWSDLQAYRTDRFSGWVKSPNIPRGLLVIGWTTATYFEVVPSTGKRASEPGLPAWIWLVGAGALVVIGAIVVLARRRGTEDEA
jgi:peptide/nickel transport system substrate-binding protein